MHICTYIYIYIHIHTYVYIDTLTDEYQPEQPSPQLAQAYRKGTL